MFKNRKYSHGFTLIEMLVVVLIIGILAGVALPQYTGAVRKARVAEAKLTLRALIGAIDRHILQYGNAYWVSLDDLDVGVETDTKNWDIYIDECIYNNNGIADGCLAIAEPKWEEGYDIRYASPGYDGGNNYQAGKLLCYPYTNSDQKKCKSLGGKEVTDGGGNIFFQL